MKSTSSIQFFAVFLGIVLLAGTMPSQSFADVISPRQQMKLDFTAEQVICSEGLVKITKSFGSKVACVKPSSAEKLAKNGWAKQLSAEKLEEIKTKIQNKGNPAGTITKIATLKQLTTGTTEGKSSLTGYSYIFDACATSKIIRAPEIFVTSDSETKSVKLGSMLTPDSCYTSSVIIKASDPNSISATLLNKGGISTKISSLETQIADLKTKINTEKQKLPKTAQFAPTTSESITNIITMKKELENLQDQLRRYLMVLYVPPNVKAVDLDIPKSLTGQPLEGMTTGIISITESVLQPENSDLTRFNVALEGCAGDEAIRLPIITVTSDSESVEVKLIERIIPNSCQVGVIRIDAVDSESITTSISGNSGISKRIATLETQIDNLQTSLADKRSELGMLVSKELDSTTTPIAEKLTLEISELRADLLESRATLYGLMLKAK